MQLKNITYLEAEAYLKKDNLIIIPLGSIEQHGPGLPLGTDTLLAELIANKLGERYDVLVAPTITPGISLVPHMNFKGTVSYEAETYTRMIWEFILSLHEHGFRRFFLVNGHGGNDGAIKNAMTKACYELKEVVYFTQNWWRIESVANRIKDELGHPPGHACASEASLMMVSGDALVKKELLTKEFSETPFQVSNDISSRYKTKTGVIDADQTKASLEFGKELFELIMKEYGKKLLEMKRF
ncbi:creatininase family protein [Candidatus Woesearchaeota archaeon]|nr:creatininase family protein [Candidatus Woesearchaeota archaeon]